MTSPRRAAILAVALALSACHDVNQEPRTADLVFATYASPNIPTPNDLALAALVSLSKANNCAAPIDACTLPAALKNAQIELLCTFRGAGGFPSDQEVPISIPLTALRLDAAANSYLPAAAPAINVATVTASTVAVLRVDVSPPAVEQVEASSAPGSCAGTPVVCTPGTLTLRKKADATGSRRWAAGARYALAVRGGPGGVRTTTGLPLDADSAIALTIPNKNLTLRENQPLGNIPDSSPANTCGAGTNADEIALLENVRGALWNPLSWSGGSTTPWHPTPSAAVTPAFAAVDAVFPHAEAAAVATFGTAPAAGALVLIDSGSGVAPLPLDLLRTGPNGTIANNPAFGPAAAGLATLDGFSTTAMLLAQTSAAVDSSTVNGGSVFLFKLAKDSTGAVTGATLVRELKAELAKAGAGDPTADPFAAGYVAQPNQISRTATGAACTDPAAVGCFSTAIGLQPAVTAPTPVGNVYLPPLAEGTSYAVVITDKVKDATGGALKKPTVARILLDFTTPFLVNGASAIPGVNTATATALSAMKAELAPVLAGLPTGTNVVTAYTFRTQSIAGTALSLSALPYSVEAGAGAAIFTPSAAVAVTPPVDLPGVSFYDVAFASVDAIDKSNGALRSTLAIDVGSTVTLPTLLKPLHALVAVPGSAAAVPPCPSPPFPAGARCAKLVVFGHGLGGSKETLFAVASSLAAQGFVAAAIDFPMHGGRAWCGTNADCTTDGTADGVCTAFTGAAGQGDAVPPGLCTTGVPRAATSGKYFIGANFFRVRDAFRQNLLDQSALALALSRPPTVPQPPGNPFTAVLPTGVIVDPSAVYYEGISLGSISGTSVAATNPRIRRAAFSVGGGSVIDVFTTAPAFTAQVDALFLSLGIDRSKIPTDAAVAANYLKTLNVAKWIVDPGEPVNFASHLKASPLPDLLANPNGSVPQAAKDVFAQVATGDAVVPNAFNLLLDNLSQASITTYTKAGGAAPHGMLATEAVCQTDAAGYLADPVGNLPPSTRDIP